MNFSKIKMPKLYSGLALLGVFLLTACGSANSGADGIYSKREKTQAAPSNSTNEYENYFANQNRQISEARNYMSDEQSGDVFVDPDQYYSEGQAGYDNQYQDQNQYEEGYYTENSYNANPSWGSNSTTVNVNYYGGYYGGYYGYNPYIYSGWRISPYYSYYYPYYSNYYYSYYPGWIYPRYYNSWYFGFGFGYGYGYGGFYYNYPYYGNYHYPYYGYSPSYHYGSRNYRSSSVADRGTRSLGLTNANTINRREVNTAVNNARSNRGSTLDNSRRAINESNRSAINRSNRGGEVNSSTRGSVRRYNNNSTDNRSQIRNPRNINAGGTRRDINRGTPTQNTRTQATQPRVNNQSTPARTTTPPARSNRNSGFYNNSNSSQRSYNSGRSNNYSTPSRSSVPSMRSTSPSRGSSGTRSGGTRSRR